MKNAILQIKYRREELMKKLFFAFTFLFAFALSLNAVMDVGKKAYNFSLKSTSGDTIRLSDLKGNIVLLDFWATWCPPCRYSLPRLVELHKKYKNKRVKIIGINLDVKEKNKKYLTAFLKKFKITYPVLFDDGTTSSIYGVRSIPQMYFIDENGVVIKKFLGFYPGLEKEFQKIIEQKLKTLKPEKKKSVSKKKEKTKNADAKKSKNRRTKTNSSK